MPTSPSTSPTSVSVTTTPDRPRGTAGTSWLVIVGDDTDSVEGVGTGSGEGGVGSGEGSVADVIGDVEAAGGAAGPTSWVFG